MSRAADSEEGQSTLEFLLIATALAAMCAALASLWHAAGDGRLLELAASAASHSSAAGLVAELKDIAGY